MRWVAVKLAELMPRKLTQPHGILVLGPAGARRKSSERGLPAGRKPHRAPGLYEFKVDEIVNERPQKKAAMMMKE